MKNINLMTLQAPVKFEHFTRQSNGHACVPCLKIMNSGRGQPRYKALVHQPEINAPYNRVDDGECWIYFNKSDNKHIKFPVLKYMEKAELPAKIQIKCGWCNSEFTLEPDAIYHDDFGYLCDSCESSLDDKSYCSTYCQLSGECDGTC